MTGRTPAILGLAIASRRAALTTVPLSTLDSSVAESFGQPHIECELTKGVAEYVADDLSEWITASLWRAAKHDYTHLGISVGGHIDNRNGVVRYAQDVVLDGEHWPNVPITNLFAERLRMPASVENDADCMAAYHQRFGVGREVDDFVVVYLAPNVHGLGCGIVTHGMLVRGISGGAGELGHVVVQPDGPRCHCGNRGCLAAVVAGSNIVREVNWGGKRDTPAESLSQAAALVEERDEVAERAFAQAGRLLGQALAGVINLLNPQVLLVGGPQELIPQGTNGTRSTELFIEGLRDKLSSHSYSTFAKDCTLSFEALGLEHAAVGAAALASQTSAEV